MLGDVAVYLVVAAHPDDPDFGVAGTAARLARDGHEVHYLMLTSGDAGSEDPTIAPDELMRVREAEQEGWKVTMLDMPEADTTTADGRFQAGLMVLLAERERYLIGERTSAALQVLKAQGRRLWPPFEELLGRRGASLIEIERTPRTHADLFRLVQAMMDYDEAFLNWRFTHMRLAFRVIGSKVLSLKGVPASQLEMGTREPLFPQLWDAISELTSEHKPSY